MEHAVAYRLSLEEIIYLSASLTKATTLFGLRSKPLSMDQLEKRWGDVKQGLLDKQILWDKHGKLTLCSDILGHIIQAISHPKALVAIRSYEDSKNRALNRLYIREMFAITVDDAPYSDDYYLLRAHTNYHEVQEMLKESVYFGHSEYEPGTASMTVDIPTLEKLMGAVKESNPDAVYNISQGFSTELAKELYDALHVKNHLMSYVVYAFDPNYNGGHRSAQEVLLYGGPTHMWEILLTENSAKISITNQNAAWDNMRVISKLMDFV